MYNEEAHPEDPIRFCRILALGQSIALFSYHHLKALESFCVENPTIQANALFEEIFSSKGCPVAAASCRTQNRSSPSNCAAASSSNSTADPSADLLPSVMFSSPAPPATENGGANGAEGRPLDHHLIEAMETALDHLRVINEPFDVSKLRQGMDYFDMWRELYSHEVVRNTKAFFSFAGALPGFRHFSQTIRACAPTLVICELTFLGQQFAWDSANDTFRSHSMFSALASKSGWHHFLAPLQPQSGPGPDGAGATGHTLMDVGGAEIVTLFNTAKDIFSQAARTIAAFKPSPLDLAFYGGLLVTSAAARDLSTLTQSMPSSSSIAADAVNTGVINASKDIGSNAETRRLLTNMFMNLKYAWLQYKEGDHNFIDNFWSKREELGMLALSFKRLLRPLCARIPQLAAICPLFVHISQFPTEYELEMKRRTGVSPTATASTTGAIASPAIGAIDPPANDPFDPLTTGTIDPPANGVSATGAAFARSNRMTASTRSGATPVPMETISVENNFEESLLNTQAIPTAGNSKFQQVDATGVGPDRTEVTYSDSLRSFPTLAGFSSQPTSSSSQSSYLPLAPQLLHHSHYNTGSTPACHRPQGSPPFRPHSSTLHLPLYACPPRIPTHIAHPSHAAARAFSHPPQQPGVSSDGSGAGPSQCQMRIVPTEPTRATTLFHSAQRQLSN